MSWNYDMDERILYVTSLYTHSFPSCTSGSEVDMREAEEQVLESLVSLTTSRRLLASLLPEVWSRAESLLAEGGEERCHLYLSAMDKVTLGCINDSGVSVISACVL